MIQPDTQKVRDVYLSIAKSVKDHGYDINPIDAVGLGGIAVGIFIGLDIAHAYPELALYGSNHNRDMLKDVTDSSRDEWLSMITAVTKVLFDGSDEWIMDDRTNS